jgi:uncharacterized protein YbbC (DUF1343 family)
MRMGLEIAALLKKMYPDKVDIGKSLTLLGNDETVRQLSEGIAPEKLVASWQGQLTAFDAVRRKYFLYK